MVACRGHTGLPPQNSLDLVLALTLTPNLTATRCPFVVGDYGNVCLATAQCETRNTVPMKVTRSWQPSMSMLQHCSSTGAMVRWHVLRGPCDVELVFGYTEMRIATPRYIPHHGIAHRECYLWQHARSMRQCHCSVRCVRKVASANTAPVMF